MMSAVTFVVLVIMMSSCSSEKSEEALSDFRTWYQEMSHDNTAMDVRNSNWGLGLFATRDIKKGDTVLQIPSKWVVSRANVLQWYKKQNLPPSITTNELLIWWLVNEKSKGTSSRFYVWIRVLPDEFHTPLQYTSDLIEMIEPEDMKSTVKKNVEETTRAWKMLKEVLEKDIDFDLYKWAKCILATRAWQMQGEEYLIPVAGMFNHDLDDEDLSYDWRKATGVRSQKFLTYHKLTPAGDAVIKSDRAVSRGDQVFESYGDNVNAIYFQYHGFVPDKPNPYDCYKLNIQKYLKSTDAHHARKLDFLQTSKMRTTTCLHTNELSDTLRLFAAVSSVKSKKVKSCLKYGKSLPYKQLIRCANNELATIKYASKIINQELSSFRTTIAEDEDLLESGLTDAMLAIVKYRYQQKLILKSVLQTAEEALVEARKRNDEKKQRKQERKRQEEEDDDEEL